MVNATDLRVSDEPAFSSHQYLTSHWWRQEEHPAKIAAMC